MAVHRLFKEWRQRIYDNRCSNNVASDCLRTFFVVTFGGSEVACLW
jgi:hypothetical protein